MPITSACGAMNRISAGSRAVGRSGLPVDAILHHFDLGLAQRLGQLATKCGVEVRRAMGRDALPPRASSAARRRAQTKSSGQTSVPGPSSGRETADGAQRHNPVAAGIRQPAEIGDVVDQVGQPVSLADLMAADRYPIALRQRRAGERASGDQPEPSITSASTAARLGFASLRLIRRLNGGAARLRFASPHQAPQRRRGSASLRSASNQALNGAAARLRFASPHGRRVASTARWTRSRHSRSSPPASAPARSTRSSAAAP